MSRIVHQRRVRAGSLVDEVRRSDHGLGLGIGLGGYIGGPVVAVEPAQEDGTPLQGCAGALSHGLHAAAGEVSVRADDVVVEAQVHGFGYPAEPWHDGWRWKSSNR